MLDAKQQREFQEHMKQLRKDIFECAFDPDVCAFATVNDLADTAGLAWTTVDNLYRGVTKRPTYHTLWRLCKAIKMPVKYIRPPAKAAAIKDSKPAKRRRKRKAVA